MAKAKSATKGKPAAGVQNRPLYSRISFLHQAATYLAIQRHTQGASGGSEHCEAAPATQQTQTPPLSGMARKLATDLRSVSLKTRIRLSPALKQYMCKYCDAVLIEGQTCHSLVENKSKGGRKPWADVLVRRCVTCGKEKRYPVSAQRTQRKKLRRKQSTKEPGRVALDAVG